MTLHRSLCVLGCSLALASTSLLLGCKPKAGAACEKGRALCQDGKTELSCQDGKYLAAPCKGPKGCYTQGQSLFCDISGFGAPYESALTQEQLKAKLGEIIAEHGPVLVAVTEHGQFQGYLGVWGAKRKGAPS